MKYLFIDSGIINGHWCSNAKLSVSKLIKDKKNNPLFLEDKLNAWEVRYDNGYPNFFYDDIDKLYKLYYSTFVIDEDSSNTPHSERPKKLYNPNTNRQVALCYAYSKDGINFVKPKLGLVEFNGSRDNNIILLNAHGASVFLDRHEKDKNKRYKMLVKIDYSRENNFMCSGFSYDGINFEIVPWRDNNPEADTHNFAFFDTKTEKYYLITRTWKNGIRISSISSSRDFLEWSKPREILRGLGFERQVYSMPVFQYSDIYIGLPSIYVDGDRECRDFDTVSVGLSFSNNLDIFDFVNSIEDFILERGEGKYPDGENDCGTIFSSTPVEIDNKLYFYYMAGNGKHTNFREGSLNRGYIEYDKFGYYTSKDNTREAIVTTSPFSIYNNDIEILADIEEGGYIVYELYDRTGYNVLENYLKNNCKKIVNSGWNKIEFNNFDINNLVGKSLAIRLYINKAKLYAIKGSLEVLKCKY